MSDPRSGAVERLEVAEIANPGPVACGDVLLTFGGTAGAAPRRVPGAGAWTASGDLWLAPPGGGWRGYPLRTFEARPWMLWLLGDLIPPRGRSPADLLAQIVSGSEPAHQLNGHLLLLAWNEAERQWHVWTDRFGTVHAYLGSDGSRAAVGTYFAAVAAVASRRRLDWPALAGFFACGFFPGDRTFFDDVRILRPASHYVFAASGALIAEERYWQWSHDPARQRSYDDTLAEFADTVHRVLDEEAAFGRIAVPISGGLDSRTTVAALTRAGSSAQDRLWAYSYGYAEDSVETRIARRVAATRGIPIESLVIGPYLFERLPGVLACVEGFQDVTQTRQAVVAELLGERADGVIAAHWGDVWLDDTGLVDEGAASAAVTAHGFKKVAKKGRDWLLREVAAPRLAGEDPEEITRGLVSREFQSLAGIGDPDFRVKAFKTEQWSFRWTLASLRMYQAGAFPRLPFYDTRMGDFFATVPTAFVAGRRMQIDYLKRFAPDLARIPWQAYGTNLFRLPHFRTWLLPARAAKKVMRMLSPPVPQRNWEVQFLGGEGRRSLERELLSSGRKLHELVSPGDLRALLDAFYAAPLEDGRGYTVSMLLTFSAWLETHG